MSSSGPPPGLSPKGGTPAAAWRQHARVGRRVGQAQCCWARQHATVSGNKMTIKCVQRRATAATAGGNWALGQRAYARSEPGRGSAPWGRAGLARWPRRTCRAWGPSGPVVGRVGRHCRRRAVSRSSQSCGQRPVVSPSCRRGGRRRRSCRLVGLVGRHRTVARSEGSARRPAPGRGMRSARAGRMGWWCSNPWAVGRASGRSEPRRSCRVAAGGTGPRARKA